jgi:hypothetical protein
MSSNNNENSAIAGAIALVVAGIYLLAIFALMALIFVSLVLTILCFFAWNSPVTLGKWTLEPDEARGFVYRGLAGACLLPAFVVFLGVFFGVQINDDYALHTVLIGYALGSIGIDILVALNSSEAAPPHQTIIPPSQRLAPPQEETPPRVPFRFASWDDEDGK